MKLADRLHKISVTSLMALTVGAGAVFTLQLYEFFTSRRRIQPPKGVSQKDIKNTGLFSSFDMISSRIYGLFQKSSLPIFFSTCRCMSQKSWNILKVNHIAVATKDLNKSVNFYKDVLGAKTSDPVPMSDHGVTTVFVELLNAKIELLLPLGDKSPIEKFLEKNPGGGMHHICLEVDNIENAVEDLKAKNIRLLGSKPTIGAHGKPVIFLHPKDCGGVLIELEQV